MIGTNRDLKAMRAALDAEIDRLTALKAEYGQWINAARVDARIAMLSRDRVALYTATVNRRWEAAKDVVVLARWASGNGALDRMSLACGEAAASHPAAPNGASRSPWRARIDDIAGHRKP